MKKMNMKIEIGSCDEGVWI